MASPNISAKIPCCKPISNADWLSLRQRSRRSNDPIKFAHSADGWAIECAIQRWMSNFLCMAQCC
ncbi:MAG: hypothetical protein V7L05_11610 [Nostoc sp.]|uniref:hypothetical protein n=1 Tax=Nostoc sp. TaxID=1180 RepID=UPI002FFD2261